MQSFEYNPAPAHRQGLFAAIALAACLALGAFLPATAARAATPSFKILSPANGSTVSNPVKLEIAVTGAKIGTPSSGDDHLHVSVNGGEAQAIYHYSHALSLTLPKGKNTIAVDLAYPTHMPVVPWQKVTFTVR